MELVLTWMKMMVRQLRLEKGTLRDYFAYDSSYSTINPTCAPCMPPHAEHHDLDPPLP
jgi:hypothetical protein